MSFSVSTLTDYTNEQKFPLIRKALTGAKTASLMTPQAGIKSAEAINILVSDAVFQAGGTCGFSASGTTALTQRVLTVGKIKVQEALCPKTLEAKYIQTQLQAGTPHALPFEALYAEEKAGQIATALETAIWQGDLLSGTANLSKFDGLNKIIDASYSAVNVNAKKLSGTVATTSGSATVTGTSTLFTTQVVAGDKLSISGVIYTVSVVTSNTAITLSANASASVSGIVAKVVLAASDFFAAPVASITVSNVIAVVDAIYKGIPYALLDKEDVRIFCGHDVFRLYVLALKTANLYHYAVDAVDFEIVIPGTNVKLVAVHGLNATSRLFALRLSNMYLGMDMLNEEEKFEIFFAKEADEIRYMAEFKMGVQVAFPDQIVNFDLA